MATINKRKVRFSIVWDKDDPTNLTWKVDVLAYVADDSEASGEKRMRVLTPVGEIITRVDFATKTGAEIQIAATKAPAFKAGKGLKDLVAGKK